MLAAKSGWGSDAKASAARSAAEASRDRPDRLCRMSCMEMTDLAILPGTANDDSPAGGGGSGGITDRVGSSVGSARDGIASGSSSVAGSVNGIAGSFTGSVRSFTGGSSGVLSSFSGFFMLRASSQRQRQSESGENHFRVHIKHPCMELM